MEQKFRFIKFNSEEEAIVREKKLTFDANFNDGFTIKYANIIKKFDENIWLIPVLTEFEYLFTLEELDNLIELSESEIYGI